MSRNPDRAVEAPDAPANPSAGTAWEWTLSVADPRLPGTVALVWKWIPRGVFRMGARGYYPEEEPMLDVEVTPGFWMLETPVTQAQWLAVQGGENPAYARHGPDWQEHPVESITWSMARGWCTALRRLGPFLPEEVAIDLPSEAVWEYACRAGSPAEYCNGDGEECLDRVGWYAENAGGRTHPVKRKEANAWGLYDMHGNVWEWCRDEFASDAYEKFLERGREPEFSEPADQNSARSMRGGFFACAAVNCRSAYRFRRRAGLGDDDDGFRACLFPGPVEVKKAEGFQESRGASRPAR